jgi:predicted dithiol-disulfide oxidoreductase (DUF899 family)
VESFAQLLYVGFVEITFLVQNFGHDAFRAKLKSGLFGEYNYRREPAWQKARSIGEWRGAEGPVATMAAMTGTDETTYTRERPGMSAFALEDGIVYHTYSTYARGVDALWCMYQWLDRAPKGRNETGVWWKRDDEYGK